MKMGFVYLDTLPSLKETTTADPDEITKLNILDSVGTLINVPCLPLPEKIQDGTRLTIADAKGQRKPFLVVSLTNSKHAVDEIIEWTSRENIRVLNIAGPRESNSPGIHSQACDLFRELFTALRPSYRI